MTLFYSTDISDSILEKQWTCDDRVKNHFEFDQANKEFDQYVTSEKIRWMCKDLENGTMRVQLLDHATKLCPNHEIHD